MRGPKIYMFFPKPGPQGTMRRRKGQMFEPGFQLRKAIKVLEMRPKQAMQLYVMDGI